jgi:hypothetical protein
LILRPHNQQCEKPGNETGDGLPAENRMIEQLPRQRVLNFLEAFYGGDTATALETLRR